MTEHVCIYRIYTQCRYSVYDQTCVVNKNIPRVCIITYTYNGHNYDPSTHQYQGTTT